MYLRTLDTEELRRLYAPCLKRDFPPDELMPWQWMEPLIRQGHQRSVGFYDEQGLAAYAIFITNGDRPKTALLNYFAVEPDRRGRGVGSECLQLMRTALAGQDCRIIFEVEDPAAAPDRETERVRQRRIAFYQRGGARATGVDSLLFGVEYHIMVLEAPEERESIDDCQLARELEALYHIAVPDRPGQDFTFDQVCQVKLTRPPESSQFSRDLGRALTFLMRSRKRFMGEKLKEYGFSGAMYLILLHVDRHPGVNQDCVATHLYVDKCSVTRRTQKLEDLGYLYRETDPSDRRQNKLFLTEKGKELAPMIRRYLGQWGNEATASLSGEEKETLIALLMKATQS